jgi:hypothetical protein
MPRRVRLVVARPDGERLGMLPEFEVESPWWPDVGSVVEEARRTLGVELTVLRILTTSAPVNGGVVSYLAELADPSAPSVLQAANASDEAWIASADDHPLRAPWARAGGVAATAAWADKRLAAMGRLRTGRTIQIKSWNLSSILLLPTAEGDAWCKSVPPFFAHEGTVLAMIAADNPSMVPTVLARDAELRTVLLGDVPGDDQWNAPEARLFAMVRAWVELQIRWAPRTGELLSAGIPDRRAEAMAALARALVARPNVRAKLTAAELDALDELVASLPRRLGDLAACGLPETLVHGDFHPGNWRFGERGLVLLDWSDSCVGHPMLDFVAFLDRMGSHVRDRVLATWLDAWRAAFPRADPSRAAERIAPIAALRQATTYQMFLDGIEPSEWRYHEDDVPRWLRRALALVSG